MARKGRAMSETRKIAAILVADIVGYSRLAGTDEGRTLSRLRGLRSDLDAEIGNHLWADRFDKPLADLFEMQDEIVARLANQLGTELMAVEARRAERTPTPDSIDLYFQAI